MGYVDDVTAANRALIEMHLNAGDRGVTLLVESARTVAPKILAELDPRTPPEAIAAALSSIGSHAAGIAAAVDPNAMNDPRVAVVLNTIAAFAHVLTEIAESRVTEEPQR